MVKKWNPWITDKNLTSPTHRQLFRLFGISSPHLKGNLSLRHQRNNETNLPRIQIVKFCLKLFMFSFVLIHCYLLTKSSDGIILSRILHHINQRAHCVQRDAPIRLALCNLGQESLSMLSATKQLRVSFVILPNEVHLFCSDPDSILSYAKMITSLTTAFEMAFPTREIRLIDEFLSTFDELTKVIVP